MLKKKYFIEPPLLDVKGSAGCFIDGYKSYSHYNYLNNNFISYFKTEHFENALNITKQFFGSVNVIDFGCADGPFLMSLSKYFNNVIGIDKDNRHINSARNLIKNQNLKNVNLICNNGMEISDLNISEKYQILFLLETLEHIGNKENLYETKINFLEDLFKLLDKNGIIIISVPKMVGLSFLMQRIGFRLLRLDQQSMSFKDLMKASILKDTSELEKDWNGMHMGFNHLKLEKYMKNSFQIISKKKSIISSDICD